MEDVENDFQIVASGDSSDDENSDNDDNNDDSNNIELENKSIDEGLWFAVIIIY